MTRIGSSDLDTFGLALGGNVFGWTTDRDTSFAVLDGFTDGGGNLVDTADSYSHWVPGHVGGESEEIIGAWLARRGRRDDVLVASKVGQDPSMPGTSRAAIRHAIEGTLKRLGTDHVDLYYAHIDDQDTPLEETVTALGELVTEGKVRALGASNFTADRLAEALRLQRELGLPEYVALQPHYNLVHRGDFEGALERVVADHHLSTLPYFALASGFLTGKYRDGAEVDSQRASGAAAYLDDRGRRVLAALDEVAAAHDTSVTAVSLAWLREQPTVVAPIASARTPEQLPDLLAGATLVLSDDEVSALTDASA